MDDDIEILNINDGDIEILTNESITKDNNKCYNFLDEDIKYNEELYDDVKYNEFNILCSKIILLQFSLYKFPEISKLKEDLNIVIQCRKIFKNDDCTFNKDCNIQITSTTLLKKQQELQLKIFNYSAIKDDIIKFRKKLIIKCMPQNVWNSIFNTTNVIIEQKYENIYKLPVLSQKHLQSLACLNSLPTSFTNPPWYHNNYRKLLINIEIKYKNLIDEHVNNINK